MREAIQRLINIEVKINSLLERSQDEAWPGHADQAFGSLTYAQHGEDLIFLNIFYLIGIRQPSYIDVGAYHPLNISNTALLYKKGCRGINIEANPNLIGEFLVQRPEDVNLNIGIGPEPGRFKFYCIDQWSGRNTFDKLVAEEFVSLHPQFQIQQVIDIDVTTLNEVVERYASGKFPNLLTIDVEGLDYEILAATQFEKSRPEIICTETLSGGDHEDAVRFAHLLGSKGYRQYFRTLGNSIFVTNEVFDRLYIETGHAY